MITTIKAMLMAGVEVALVNDQGFVVRVSSTFDRVGVYTDSGRFVSLVTLEVEGFTFVK